MAGSRPQSNFTHLKAHDEQLVRLTLSLGSREVCA